MAELTKRCTILQIITYTRNNSNIVIQISKLFMRFCYTLKMADICPTLILSKLIQIQICQVRI